MTEQTRIALVTGAGSGIGRAAALALLDGGYRVGLIGRRPEALAETASLAGDRGGNARILVADVTDPAALNAAFDALVAEFGRLDVVFNNAGIGAPAISLDELTIDTWKKVVDTNLSGVFYGMQAAFRIMRRQTPQGGRIINNGSISAYTPRPNTAPYTATKHAVLGLTKSGALDGRKYNIAVGQIDVGNAATEMAAPMAKGIVQAHGEVAVEPTMDVRHVGEAVLHMANLALEANILTMTVMATKMPFVGRG